MDTDYFITFLSHCTSEDDSVHVGVCGSSSGESTWRWRWCVCSSFALSNTGTHSEKLCIAQGLLFDNL